MGNMDKKALSNLYKIYSDGFSSNTTIRRKIKTRIYKDNLNKSINFIKSAKDKISSIEEDITYLKTQKEIAILMSEKFKLNEYKTTNNIRIIKNIDSQIENLQQLKFQIMNEYNYLISDKIIRSEMKHRGYKIINIVK